MSKKIQSIERYNEINQIEKYLHDIGVTGNTEVRINGIVKFYNEITGNSEPQEIFITDYYSEDGNRCYESLWIFYNNYACEAKKFLSENDFDMATVSRDSVVYWRLQTKDFNFETPTDSSRISFRVDYSNRVNCEIKAARNNCVYFMKLIKKYFV